MNRPRPGPRTVALAISLIFALASGYGLLKLFESFEIHNRQPLDRLWVVSQAEFEYQRLLNTLDRYALGDSGTERDELWLRLDILWSRLGLMEEGN
ncbi:MAG: hypothetical protein R3310_09485, partial [Candidatus Competibacteraceae bacterium]|nr:hypothetical protein [Candidatus Competibacteraceae bacterium]